MISIEGRGVSGGSACGPLYFYQPSEGKIPRYQAADRDAEWTRFLRARAQTVSELAALSRQAEKEAGEKAGSLFSALRMLAQDPEYAEAVRNAVFSEGRNAEAAAEDAAGRFAARLREAKDPYLRERSADIREVSGRIIGCLIGGEFRDPGPGKPSILAAETLAPEDLIRFGAGNVLGLLLGFGSETAHVVILARILGIPAVAGADIRKLEACGAREAVLLGTEGKAFLDPDDEIRSLFLEKHAAEEESRIKLESLRGLPDETGTGKRIRVFCNIGAPGDAASALSSDASGIGLFRSEFLFLGRENCPTEEEQFEAYRQILRMAEGKPAVIRTLDPAPDKNAPCFGLTEEEAEKDENRGIRYCLSHPDLFRTQLRALLRASVYGNLGILFPMVHTADEVRAARNLAESLRKELAETGISVSPDIRFGVMIETKEAVLHSRALAEEADFFSCGTNDLMRELLGRTENVSDPGCREESARRRILELLRTVCENAQRSGIPVGICGELASDLRLTETLVSIGIDCFSVSPGTVLALRERIRGIGAENGKN